MSSNLILPMNYSELNTALPKFKLKTTVNGSHNNLATLTLITDEFGTVYVDGVAVLSPTRVLIVEKINITSSFRTIAIVVNNVFGHIGFMAETSTGVVTNKLWKCTHNVPIVQESKWMKVNFDDSQWLNAVPYADNSGSISLLLGKTFSEFPEKRLWISVKTSAYSGRLYCRRTVKTKKP